MKILHLADLHIGKVILEQSMIEDQKYMLEQIIEKIKEEKIELVLISGDVYDRSVPPADAVTLLNNFLKVLVKELKIKVCIISGNHDSKERLSFGKEIFENDGLYIVTDYKGNVEKVTFDDEYGKLNIYMLPYIKPIEVRQYFEDKEIDSYDSAIKNILENEKVNTEERNIILTHQFITAGGEEPEKSDSETLTLGGTENVDISRYKDFDYVAIGHIHGPQRIGRDTARYAGTMLKYSFSEAHHTKSLCVLDFKEKGNLDIKLVPLVPLRDMRIIKGPIEELIKEENYIGTNREDYIRAIITNEEPVYDAIGKIKKVYPNTLRLDIENSKVKSIEEASFTELDKIKEKDELELFDEFYEFQNGQKLSEKQREILAKAISIAKKGEK